MFERIVNELKAHSPFTLFGAMTGVVLMMVFKGMDHDIAHKIFYILHPAHVVLSAMVTTAIYCHYTPKAQKKWQKFWKVLLIGYVGAIGIGTLSDSLIPFWGETLLEMPHAKAHIGFIEQWWLINPLVVIAIIVAYFKPATKFPHAGHVLLSTWASLFHMIMASGHDHGISYFGVFIFLFIAVWVPCCLSDIIFPLLFVKDKSKIKNSGCGCPL
ncbi:MAG: hypothetical protein KAR05_01875 [Candidatus Omnitrophica bacterium]|nr:hypothetical protein [Candidatus Omnitrophota bacterium]